MNLEIGTEDLRLLLREGKVNFEYKKKDESLRQALGTLKPDLIPKDQLPKNKKDEDKEEINESNLKYWDLDKDAWRALSSSTEVVTLLK